MLIFKNLRIYNKEHSTNTCVMCLHPTLIPWKIEISGEDRYICNSCHTNFTPGMFCNKIDISKLISIFYRKHGVTLKRKEDIVF